MAKNQKPKSNELTKIQDIQIDKIGVFFKRSILKSIVKILVMEHSGFRTFKSVKNINRLFTNIDLTRYQNNQELLSYIWCINYISKQWLDGIVNPDIIFEMAKRQPEFDNIKEDIISTCMNDPNIISSPEAKSIFDLIGDALQYGYVTAMKEEYINLMDDINLDDPGAFRKLVERLFLVSQSLLDIKHNTNMVANKITFNTADIDSIKIALSQTIDSLKTSNNIFKTGIRRLNTLLSPGYMNGRLYVYLGLPAGGKAQPDDTMIPTPTGMKRLDELKIGDKVFNLYGNPVTVTNIFPQGIQPTYKVTFTDGRSTRCNPDHLWYTLEREWCKSEEYTSEMKSCGLEKYRFTKKDIGVVKSLKDMMDDYVTQTSSDIKYYKYIIPNNGIAKFEKRRIPIDPKSLGSIIKSSKYGKRIPENYLFNLVSVRKELLRGLINIDESYSDTVLHTSSLKFIEDMKTLLSSLGIKYNISEVDKFDIIIKTDDLLSILQDKNIAKIDDIRICNIERVEDCSQRCILIDDPLHVYLTEQFIPTHNSLMLLKSALDIRKYNPDFKPKVPGMKPCVLYITMENTFTETIERIWNMTFDDSIVDYELDEALDKICNELGITRVIRDDIEVTNVATGEKSLAELIVPPKDEGKTNIEIVMKYFPYREISTDDLFTIIQDLKDESLEVDILVFDYIKRIRPSSIAADNVKLELNRIINELKALAVIEDIPVITAHQMNRAAAATVDAATRAGKSDTNKLVGRENVGDA